MFEAVCFYSWRDDKARIDKVKSIFSDILRDNKIVLERFLRGWSLPAAWIQ